MGEKWPRKTWTRFTTINSQSGMVEEIEGIPLAHINKLKPTKKSVDIAKMMITSKQECEKNKNDSKALP